ncbi:hypothetical protein [Alkalihalobacterium elongatum]|uniref:hypothetical protein n=1 Tax=Alkalihalobacterium elongatum TaxID=2675466 RepID=UPI001C1FEA91|nr:hypothetical protein [Alkalihalobacterium elongatum]
MKERTMIILIKKTQEKRSYLKKNDSSEKRSYQKSVLSLLSIEPSAELEKHFQVKWCQAPLAQ